MNAKKKGPNDRGSLRVDASSRPTVGDVANGDFRGGGGVVMLLLLLLPLLSSLEPCLEIECRETASD